MATRFLSMLLDHPEFVEGDHWERRRFDPHTEIVKQGDESRNVYFVQNGTVRVIGRIDIGDQRQVSPGVCDLGEGEIFGELVLFDDKPRSASVVAVTDCELVVLDGDKLMRFLEDHPETGFKVLRGFLTMLVQRLRTTNKKIFSLFAWGLKAHNIDEHL